jgi:hypothetical protein
MESTVVAGTAAERSTVRFPDRASYRSTTMSVAPISQAKELAVNGAAGPDAGHGDDEAGEAIPKPNGYTWE